MSNFIALEDAAKRLDMTADELVAMRSRGGIFGHRDGASWKFKPEEIERVAREIRKMMAHDVFIAHSSKDKSIADAVCVAMEQKNIRCWLAPRDLLPGVEWGQSIAKAIKNCRVVVFVFSNASRESRQVINEIARSDQEGKPLIVFRISDIMPSGGMVFLLSSAHRIDAVSPPIEPQIDRLIDLVRKVIGARLMDSNTSLGDEISEPTHKDFALADDDDSVLGEGSDLALGNDSGINLMSPSDSGISLEDEPLDLAGSGISYLDLAAEGSDAFESAAGSEVGSSVGLDIEISHDEEFQLSPSAASEADDDSGSQVIGLEDYSAFGDTSVALPAADGGFGDAGFSDELSLQCDDDDLTSQNIEANLRSGLVTERGYFGVESSHRDQVDCSIFAPPVAKPGDDVLVQVFIHTTGRFQACFDAAVQIDSEAAKRGARSLGTAVSRGSTISLQLEFASLSTPPQYGQLTWAGESNSVQFLVQIPSSESSRSVVGVLLISVDTVPVGDIKFKLQIDAKLDNKPELKATGAARRFQHAFISYASADREEVLLRVQMLRAVGISFFQDILDLDPGERWEKKLYLKINDSDVMFLFWSTQAKKSAWVEKEWRYGLEHKGDDFIYPVIIEGPPIPTPPDALKHIHFNDKILHFIKATNNNRHRRIHWWHRITFWKRKT